MFFCSLNNLKQLKMSYLYLGAICIMLFSCKKGAVELPVVGEVDLEKYSGTWYEIARLPNSFEKGLKCVTATYRLREDGKIEVINRGHKTKKPGKISKIRGVARVPDMNQPAKLKVTFFWPFSGNYYIIELDKDYRYALVGEPSRKYLWILARDKELEITIYEKLLRKAEELGFDSKSVVETDQDC
jgi:apolipoprotein D and lipocalin family protein